MRRENESLLMHAVVDDLGEEMSLEPYILRGFWDCMKFNLIDFLRVELMDFHDFLNSTE